MYSGAVQRLRIKHFSNRFRVQSHSCTQHTKKYYKKNAVLQPAAHQGTLPSIAFQLLKRTSYAMPGRGQTQERCQPCVPMPTKPVCEVAYVSSCQSTLKALPSSCARLGQPEIGPKQVNDAFLAAQKLSKYDADLSCLDMGPFML